MPLLVGWINLRPRILQGDVKMRKIPLITAMVLFCLVGTVQAKEHEINIALWKLPFNVPSMIALENKSYEKAFAGSGLVNYVQLSSGPKQIQAMAAGALDIAEGIGAAAVIVGKANGVGIKIIGVNSRSPGAFAVMTNNPNIKTITDLKGKKVAGLRGSVVHELFAELLENEGMDEKDLEFYLMPVAAAATALLSKRVDAALLVGMEIKRAQSAGARILADGTGHVEGLSVIAVRSEFLNDYPDVAAKYLETRDKIRKEIFRNPNKSLLLVTKETGLLLPEAKDMLTMYDYDTRITDNDVKELTKTVKYLLKEGIIKSNPDINELIWNKAFR